MTENNGNGQLTIKQLEARVKGLACAPEEGSISVTEFSRLGTKLALERYGLERPVDMSGNTQIPLDRVRKLLTDEQILPEIIESVIADLQERTSYSLRDAVLTKSGALEKALFEAYDWLGLKGYKPTIPVISIPGTDIANKFSKYTFNYNFSGEDLRGTPNVIRYDVSVGSSGLIISATHLKVVLVPHRFDKSYAEKMYKNESRLFSITVEPPKPEVSPIQQWINKLLGYQLFGRKKHNRLQFYVPGVQVDDAAQFLTQHQNGSQKDDPESIAFAYAVENLDKVLDLHAKERTYHARQLAFSHFEKTE